MLLLEGLSSNFYAITRDSTILAAPRESVLTGTTQLAIEEICASLGMPVDHSGCTLSNLISNCTAAFITSNP